MDTILNHLLLRDSDRKECEEGFDGPRVRLSMMFRYYCHAEEIGAEERYTFEAARWKVSLEEVDRSQHWVGGTFWIKIKKQTGRVAKM